MKNLIPLPLRRSVGNWWHRRQTQIAKRTLLENLHGSGTTCNVCGWEGRAFTDDAWHPGSVCPSCGSQVRHRLLAGAFEHLNEFRLQTIIAGKRVLHFAPERTLRAQIQAAAAEYVSADFDRGDVDLRLDISQMPQVASGHFDVLICCDVLEHVPDDHAAYREIRRVLVPGGLAILTVPQRDAPAVTDEDETVTLPQHRLERFGQRDHVRMFGQDFSERLSQHGFLVRPVTESDFSATLQKRHVLAPPTPSTHPLATNHRRIYFCTSPGPVASDTR